MRSAGRPKDTQWRPLEGETQKMGFAIWNELKPSLLQETAQTGGDKLMAIFSQKRARNYDHDELFLSVINDFNLEFCSNKQQQAEVTLLSS